MGIYDGEYRNKDGSRTVVKGNKVTTYDHGMSSSINMTDDELDKYYSNRAFDDESNYKGGWLKENADKAVADRAERARQRKLDQLKKWHEGQRQFQLGQTPEQKGQDREDEKLFNAIELRALEKFPSGGQKIIRDIKKAGLG
jgi:hypothetical protein